MSVPLATRAVRYVAAAGQTVFPYPWLALADTDFQVTRVRAGVPQALLLNLDYSVTGLRSAAGGTIVLTEAAQAGDLIAIAGAQPIERTTDFSDSGDFRARALNAELDRLVIAQQQLAAAQQWSIRLPFTDDPATTALPVAAERAGRVLGFDAQGRPIVTTPDSFNGVLPSSFGADLIQASDAAVARALLEVAAAVLPSSFGADLIQASDAAVARALLEVAASADVMLRNGSQPPLADTPWGGFRITNLAAGTASDDAVTKNQLETGYRLRGIVRYASAGSGTYTTPAGVRALLIRAIGGGGGGGGGGSVGGGGGGGSGGYCEIFLTTPASSYPYTVGAGGAFGASDGGDGGNGGNTTIAGLIAGGGSRGFGGNLGNNVGGSGGAASGGHLNVRGSGGSKGVIGTGATPGGAGGAGVWGGAGGASIGSNWQGDNGVFGGGGSGGSPTGSGAQGQVGGAGYIEIWEWL